MIEMAVVVAIIGILALMAIPNFTDKVVREQIVEAAKLADLAKGPVAVYWAASGTKKEMPADNAAASLPVADKIVSNLVSSLAVENGALHLQFGNNAHRSIKGKVLTLRPAVVEDAPVVPPAWVCAAGRVPDKMVVKGADKTSVDTRFLPYNCLAPAKP